MEHTLTFPDPAILALVRHAHVHGTRVVLVSDTYFSAAQIEDAKAISDARMRLWERYYEAFAALELQFQTATRPPVNWSSVAN